VARGILGAYTGNPSVILEPGSISSKRARNDSLQDADHCESIVRTTMSTKPVLAASIERAMCVRASCDPRTLRKYLAGKTVMPMTRARIEEALRGGGYGHLVRAPQREGAPAPVGTSAA